MWRSKHHIFNGAHQTTQRLSPTPLTRIFIWITCRCGPTLPVYGLILAGHTYFRIYVPVIPANPLAVSLNAHLCGWSEPLDCRRRIDICTVCSQLPRSTLNFPREFSGYGHVHTHTYTPSTNLCSTHKPGNAGLCVNCVTFFDTHLKPKRLCHRISGCATVSSPRQVQATHTFS